MQRNDVKPPRWAQRFLEWYCRPEILEDLQGDLNEYFQRNLKTKSITRARVTYILDVLKFFRLYTVRKPEFVNLLIQWIMIGSYIKTSGRNIVRNKLFSSINIIGLAISMSVGLLMVSILWDLLSYDRFHENKDRIYRVVSTHQFAESAPHYLASTSVKSGMKIKETTSGIEDITIVRRNFKGDAHVDKNIVPIQGLWADEHFFKIFTFPLLKGAEATALKEPYSIVLTEKLAKKLFGDTDAFGKSVTFDTVDYVVTGVLKSISPLSHLQFEALVSFSTVELQEKNNKEFLSWGSIFSNHVYLLLPQNHDVHIIESNLDKLSQEENASIKGQKITLSLQPMKDFVLGTRLENSPGPVMPPVIVWVLGGLALIVLLSACFNYTNLSIARSFRRSREVGIRKVIGANKNHVRNQFISESVIISLIALTLAFVIFLLIRSQFLSLTPQISQIVRLELSPMLVLYFIGLAVLVGIVAGFLPALFFSRINAIQVLKDISSMKVFHNVSMRKTLVVIQYTFSLIFIITTIIGYNQYKHLLSFNLGFRTENILNIYLQGNKTNLLKKELEEIPEVTALSGSRLVQSLGSLYAVTMKYTDPSDSSGVYCNVIDDKYLPLHGHTLLAGKNFTPKLTKDETEVIVNEQMLKRFNIAGKDPLKALGETVIMGKTKLTIVGVVKDFHYTTVFNKIEPFMFRYSPEGFQYINVKINSEDWPVTLSRIEKAWRKIDNVHPLDAAFYDDQIEHAYSQFSVMIKVIGFLAFLAISIASMGLFGMVVFTTETRLKEISIRKVLGAGEAKLIYLLSKGFLFLLLISSLVALPITYFFFDRIVLANIAYHAPITVVELFTGVFVVMLIAFLMIGSQTLKAARTNPAEILKTE